MTEMRWQLLPYFLLRSTGFPFEYLEQLTFQHTVEALEALFLLEEERDQRQTALEMTLRSNTNPQSLKLKRACRKQIQRQSEVTLTAEDEEMLGAKLSAQFAQWNENMQALRLQEVEARAAFAQELLERRQQLRMLAEDETIQEALWLSSPQVVEHGLMPYLRDWDSTQRPSKVRHFERQFISYLQRLCAKNETTSFFGPLNYGDFSPPLCAVSLPGPGAQHVQKRVARLAFWGVQALEQAIVQDALVFPYLKPMLSPVVQLDPQQQMLTVAAKQRVRLSPHLRSLLCSLNGKRTVFELADLLHCAPEQMREELQRLMQSRVVIISPGVPVTNEQPLEWLLAWCRQLPSACQARAHWVQVLSTLKQLQDDFAVSCFAERKVILTKIEEIVQEVTHKDARRNGGAFYGDRLLLYEECLGGMSPFSVGPQCQATLRQQLEPVLTLYAQHGSFFHKELQAHGAKLLYQLAEDGRVPLLAFLSSDIHQNAAFRPSKSPVQLAIEQQLQEHVHEHQVQLDEALLKAAFTESIDGPFVTSPDVMLLAADEAALARGQFQVVVSECHDTLMIWGWALHFHPQRDQVESTAGQLLRQAVGNRTVANVLASKRVKIVPFEYPGPTIEIMAQSAQPAHQRIAIADVQTKVEQGVPLLETAQWHDLQVYNGELLTLAHAIFALPRVVPPTIDMGIHTPRITLGSTILQREKWHFSRDLLKKGQYQGDSFEWMRDILRIFRHYHIPRHVYVRAASEPKPVYLDTHNYFLLELLHYLLEKNTALTFSEMLPGPEQLWLKSETGSFCSELRLSAFCVQEEAKYE